MLRVLVACEFSGTVRDAFSKLGHDAWSCDILPTESPGNHFQEDIFHVLCGSLSWRWDLIIAHPPCTYLANSGVRWLWNKDGSRNLDRWAKMEDGARFFKSLLWSNCDHLAIENPIPHKYALEIIGKKYNQTIQPWQFGHGETKATCLWLKELPKLEPTEVVEGREQRIWKLPPSKDRSKLRSVTYQGIAEAMAEQYSRHIENQRRLFVA